MKRFFARIGRFFWSGGFLKFVLWTATIIVLFYAEEDWRGSRVWAATKATWEAKGETFDFAKFQPPPVPDAQNLGALPLFQSSPAKDWRGRPVRDWLIIQKALGGKTYDNDFPSAGNWMRGDTPDMKKIVARIAAEYAARLKAPPLSPDPLERFETLCPFIADLRREAAERPLCRLDTEDGSVFPVEQSYRLLESLMLLSKYLVVDALLQLDHGRSDLALADLRIIATLRSGVARVPGLVSPGFAAAMTSLMNGGVHAGLVRHAWSDDQLAELQRIESALDFLALYSFDLRAEAAASILDTPLMESDLGRRSYAQWAEDATGGSLPWWFAGSPYTVFLWPRGWFQIDMAHVVDGVLDRLPTIDLAARQVRLEIGRQLREKAGLPGALKPWNVRSLTFYGEGDPVYSFALGQAWADEAIIACALERYRLAHQVYPSTLDALVPGQIASVPHDVMTGQPFHYHVRPDGSFLLYSVGWLQKDEGGKITLRDDGFIDSQKSNWTWPSAKP
jgi:hypothetical protein